MKIIQPHPHTDTSGTLVGIIRGTGKNIHTDFVDDKPYIDAWNRVSYLHAVSDGEEWASATFKIFSKDPKIIDLVDKMHVYKKGDLVLCQANIRFSPDSIMYETMPVEGMYGVTDEDIKTKSVKKYLINKTTLDELCQLEHFKNLLGKYKDTYLSAIKVFRTPKLI